MRGRNLKEKKHKDSNMQEQEHEETNHNSHNNQNISDTKQKIVSSFNRTLKEFADDLVITFPEYRNIVLQHYHQIEETDERFIQWFERETKQYFFELSMKNETVFTELCTELYLFPEINFCFIWKSKITTHTKDALWKYLHTMLLLLAHYQMDVSSGDIGSTFEEWNKLLDENKLEPEKMEEIQRQAEQMLKLMETLTENLTKEDSEDETSPSTEQGEGTDPTGNGGEPNSQTEQEHFEQFEKDLQDDPFFQKIRTSKLAHLAGELVQEISSDLGNLNDVTNVNDILKLLGKNPMKVMNLMKTVGNKIQTKLNDGNITQQEIISETQDIMSSIQDSKTFKRLFKKAKKGGMPDPSVLFNQFAQQMGGDQVNLGNILKQFGNLGMMPGVATGMGAGSNPTRDRLRKKMEARQQQTQSTSSSSTQPPQQNPFARSTSTSTQQPPAVSEMAEDLETNPFVSSSSGTTSNNKKKRKHHRSRL